jgi:hypothetical protein
VRAEWASFKTRMEGSPVLAGKVHPIIRKNGDEPVRTNYAVAKSAPPDRLGDGRMAGVQRRESDQRYTYDVRLVGTTSDALDVWGEALLGQMLGHRLSVPGRRCSPIELVENIEEGDGYDRTSDLYFRDLSFRFWSRRGPTPEETP